MLLEELLISEEESKGSGKDKQQTGTHTHINKHTCKAEFAPPITCFCLQIVEVEVRVVGGLGVDQSQERHTVEFVC